MTNFLAAMVLLSAVPAVAVASDDDERRGGRGQAPKNAFNIMMNYELGMHCTGFEFAYCCVLPPYNSILAQVVKTQQNDQGNAAFAKLLEGDPNVGLDALNRQTVLRDSDLVGNEFQKYVLRYWHDAQPRNDGRGKPQATTLISAVEGNSLFMWNTIYDAAAKNPDGSLVTGEYNGAAGVVLGDGDFNDPNDSYANGWMNHFYIYSDLEGGNPNDSSLEADKIRLGVDIIFPEDCGPALHPMGPDTQDGDPNNPVRDNTCGGASNGNVLTFSGEHGTIVYTQMKVLENLPVTLTSPRIWEALGLPLTPFEDTIDFFGDPGLVDEDSIRPYVEMRAQLHHFDAGQPGGIGAPVMDRGQPVIGLGTAPIDIPNCERCHSNPPGTANSPNGEFPGQFGLVQQEYDFWNAFYNIDTGAGDSDWYSRLKSAAISMLSGHDFEHGTSFAVNYPADPNDPNNPGAANPFPQNTRLGHESVICQKCHADNVIAVVKSATCASNNGTCEGGTLIRPISEAVHRNHRNVTEDDENGEPGVIVFNDSLGRDGGCQGCHPAHRSDGDMAGYPITLGGENFYADSDNRLASGGCFVGRDVHSNPLKDIDGAETPEHLNPVGRWLQENVSRNQAGLAGSDVDQRGIWCTNCHTQLGQEMWKAENMEDLIHEVGLNNVREPGDITGDGQETIDDVAAAVGVSTAQALNWLDPKVDSPMGDTTHAIWKSDPGLCEFLVDPQPEHDATVATIEVANRRNRCTTRASVPGPDCDGNNQPDFQICGSFDGDGDFSVNILDFCTTPDCVADAQASLGTRSSAVAVPFSAATDGRDHWLSPGEPHCADCHSAPYVEQSGNINAFAPFNYPRKASLMRYSRGHRDLTCQGCHESIHGLYPVTPTIDTTTYAQAAGLNSDDSHGPLKCGSCHRYDNVGATGQVPSRVCAPGEERGECDDGPGIRFEGRPIANDFDAAVSWAHTFTDEHDPRQDFCLNCHGDESDEIGPRDEGWLEHAMEGRVSRKTMDQVEILTSGQVFGAQDPLDTVCEGCHSDESDEVACNGEDGREWKRHLSEGRVAESVWEEVSVSLTGSTCGW